MNEFKEVLNYLKKSGIYPQIGLVKGCPTNTEVFVNNKKVLLFCSNDYLGLANNYTVKKAAHRALDIYGVGSGGSRLISGNTDIQIGLERAIADFKGAEDAITFATGYMANMGVIPAITNIHKFEGGIFSIFKNDKSVIFSDEFNHASIVDGCRLSYSEICIYKHKDMRDLEFKLKKYRKYRKLIITDGVFSMDGDIAPIPEIVRLADNFDSMIMIDDAHASGVLGKSGKGTLEHFGLPDDSVDIVMGTFTKAFGGVGGFVVGGKDLMDYLRISVRSYIFTAPIPPVIAASLLEAIKEAGKNNRRESLLSNVVYLRNQLKNIGFNLLDSETQIMPIFVGDEKKCVNISKELLNEGIFLPSITWPAVRKGMSRLRLTVKADHTKKQIDELLEKLILVGNKYKIIKQS